MFKKILSFVLICFLAAFCFGVAITSDPWDGTKWLTTAPNDEALVGNTYKEIQDLRKGIGIRIAYEHTAFAASSVGGAHIPGGCNILFYGATAAIDANVTAGTFENFGLIYDTTLLQFFTMNAAETAKVAMTIGTAGIADGNVLTADIADSNVTTGKLADSAVTTVKIADANVTAGKMAANSILTASIADSNITVGKIDFFIDEDTMATDSAVKVPSQQSVKAYVDASVPTTFWNSSWSEAFAAGTPPTTWTDLDLHLIVGANRCLVMLKMVSSANENKWFRTNGDTHDYSAGSIQAYGCNMLNNAGYIMLETDTGGIIEWKSAGATSTVITLIGYIK